MTARNTAGAVSFGALAIAACVLTPTPADATEAPVAPTASVTVDWLLTNTELPTSETASWPQSYLKATDCGWVRRDTYDTSTPENLAIVNAILADGILEQGEDYGVIVSWEFVYVDCPVATVDPLPTDTATPVDTTARDAVSDIQAATKPVPELAATGVDMATPSGVAFLLIVGGLILWSTRFFGKRASK